MTATSRVPAALTFHGIRGVDESRGIGMQNPMQQGFNLIELMSVVAIIAILAAVATPAYEDYAVRARVAELATVASAMKVTAGENIANLGAIGAGTCTGVTNVAAGDALESAAASSCTDATGVIAVTGTAAAKGVVLTFTPMLTGSGAISWRCTSAAADHKYVPPECRNV